MKKTDGFLFFDIFGNELRFASAKEYFNKRRKIDNFVYQDGFEKKREEKWEFLQFFDKYVENTPITGEYILRKSEQPDIIIETNKSRTGIEVTKATNEEYMAALTHARNEENGAYPINTYFGTNKKVGKKNLSKTFQKPTEELRGMAVYGNYAVEQCTQEIIGALEKKLIHLNENEYQGIENIELLIYQCGPYKYADIKALEWALYRKAEMANKYQRKFSKVHVLKGSAILYDIFDGTGLQ